MIESIEFNNDARSRTVVRRSNSRSTGKYFSWKTNRMHQFESMAERNTFRSLDCDPNVKAFLEQPCLIRYWLDGVIRKHYPDLLVRFINRSELWEVKTLADGNDEEVWNRTLYMERALLEHGYIYRQILAHSVARDTKTRNQELLIRFGRGQLSNFARTEMISRIRQASSITWAEAAVISAVPDGRRVLCRLVLEGTIAFDQNSLICGTTVFALNSERL